MTSIAQWKTKFVANYHPDIHTGENESDAFMNIIYWTIAAAVVLIVTPSVVAFCILPAPVVVMRE